MSKACTVVMILTVVTLTIGCSAQSEQPGTSTVSAAASATELAHEILVIDTHIDLPERLKERPADVLQRTTEGHFDYPRAREGGLDAAFMAIYIPATLQGTGTERQEADELIDGMEQLVARAPDRLCLARSPEQVRESFAKGLVALPLGIENGAAIQDDLGALEHFLQRGVRYITLCHSRANQICDSSYDEDRPWHGLSPFGRQVVAEMNRLGIMVDISHVSDESFDQVVELSTAPVIASHSCCRHFTPGFERNLSDEMIIRVGDTGGVVQVAFGSAFLLEQAQKQSSAAWASVQQYLEEHGLSPGSAEAGEQLKRFYEEHPPVQTNVSDVVDHIEYVISLAGIDHVGLGSDFDGVSQLPVGLEDVAGYPNLIGELLARGYSEQDIRKICGENLLRVWTEVERVAKEAASHDVATS